MNKKTIETFVSRNGIIFKGSKETLDALINSSKRITRNLKTSGRYEITDDDIIDSLAMCLEVRNMAFFHIKEFGVMMYIDKRRQIKQKNHSVSTLLQMNKSILDISSRLGLSPLDRLNLKLEVKKDDGLDD